MKKILNFLKPEWITQKWREGSMGAAEKKSTWRSVIGGSVILVTVLSMMWFNLFDTYLYQYYARQGVVAHFFSWVFGLTSIYALWKSPDFSLGEKDGYLAGLAILSSLALSLLIGGGFNFDLNGIE